MNGNVCPNVWLVVYMQAQINSHTYICREESCICVYVCVCVKRSVREDWQLIPDIRICCEHSIFQRLWGHPADRQQPFASFAIVIGLVDIPCHAKVWTQKESKHELEEVFKCCESPVTPVNQILFQIYSLYKHWDLPPILTVKSSATMQFLAARSRWTNLLALRYAIPSAISPAIWIIFFSGGKDWLLEPCYMMENKRTNAAFNTSVPLFHYCNPFVKSWLTYWVALKNCEH